MALLNAGTWSERLRPSAARQAARRRAVVLALACSWACHPGLAVWASELETFAEYEVKAALLYKFTKFVEWPEEAFAADPSHHVFCIFGRDPFGRVLDQALAEKSIAGRETAVRRVRRPEDLPACQLVFVASSEMKQLPRIVAILEGEPVLTVGESPRFARRGGIINFLLEEGRIRFEINPRAADRAGLRVSSHLLRLARVVDVPKEGE